MGDKRVAGERGVGQPINPFPLSTRPRPYVKMASPVPAMANFHCICLVTLKLRTVAW